MQTKHEENIRILHCVGHMKRAGAETFIMNVYKNIDRTKVQFDFLCVENRKGDYDNEIQSMGGNLYYLDNNAYNFPGKLNYMGKVFRFKKAFSKHPEVAGVHIHGHHAFDILLIVIASKLAGVKKIYVHSHNTFAPHPKLNKIFANILGHSKVVKLACGIAAGNWLFGDKADYTVINNGINIEKFKYSEQLRSEIREEFGICEDQILLLHVGRFEEQKNHKFLVDVYEEFYKRNNNSVLIMVGEGFLQDEIREKFNELSCKNNVIFTGVRNDVSALMSAADVFIMPSLFEGFPVTVVEAQVSGLGCVLSDVITREVEVNDNVKFVGLDQSLKVWVQTIKLLLDSEYDRKKGFLKVKQCRFDIKDVVQKLESLYLNNI